MSLARKDLELRMTITTDASKATAAMQQLAREAERAGMSIKSMNAGGTGAGGGGTGGSPVGLLGRVQGLAVGGAGQLAAGAAIIATIGGVHKAMLDLDSGLLTVREKTLNFAKAIPIVGEALSSFVGNLMDARDRMLDPQQYMRVQQMKAENPTNMAIASARLENDQKRGAWRQELAGSRYGAQATREYSTIASGQSLLTSSIGGVAGSFINAGLGAVDPRLTDAMEAIQMAKRGSSVADRTAADSAAEVIAARAKSDRLQREFRATKADSEAAYDAARGGGMSQSRSDKAGQAAFDRFGFNSNPEAGYLRRFGNELGAVTIGTTARQIGRLSPDRVLDGHDKGSNLSMQEEHLRE
ncbi:MAG: hypothetical protein C0467_31500 [Planctomycetaceae bacterium]|nr:hypothetical protein [Planctomycetaceae bacterium]